VGCTYVPFPSAPGRPYGSVQSRPDDEFWINPDRSIVVAPVFESATLAPMQVDSQKARPLDAFTQRSTQCNLHFAQWVPEQVCVVVADAVATSRVALFPSSAGRAEPPARVFDAPSELTQLCSRQLWVSYGGGAAMDLSTTSNDVAYLGQLAGGTSSSFNDGDAAGDTIAFIMDPRGTQRDFQTWSWSAKAGAVKLESSSQGQRIDITFDGRDIAWREYIENTATPGRWMYDVYTFPYVAGSTNATKRLVGRLPPEPYCGSQRVGGGYYAMTEGECNNSQSTARLHLFRLSDGRHWTVEAFSDPEKPGAVTRPTGVLYIDEQEVIYRGDGIANRTSSIIRQRIDALGPGEAR
jgi:hypothetical protein